MRSCLRLMAVAASVAAAIPGHAAGIRGDYLEARTSDVWTGPCFANGEVNLAGKEATLAWRVADGAWNGVDLIGLSVVGVVRGDATLGDPHRAPVWMRARIFVDDRADEVQRAALESMARDLAGGLLDSAPRAEAVAIDLAVDAVRGAARLDAGNVAEIRTRRLGQRDMHCGNEEVYYEPLAPVVARSPVLAVVHEFRGEGLGATWRSNDKRSAFLARFER